MTRLLFVSAAMFVAASSASAQDVYTKATGAARKAAAATDAHIAAEQRPDAPAPRAASPTPASRIVASNATSAKPGTKSSRTTPADSAATSPDTAGPPPTVYREAFAYEPDGRRDPFVSLLTTNELRPTMSDLRLTGILYDQSGGRHSVATLRDVSTNQQYRVTLGTALGRMRVAAIGVKRVLFTIDEFGTTRQDSLVLGDSTKARAK